MGYHRYKHKKGWYYRGRGLGGYYTEPNSGCCCLPGCVIMLLTIPIWPLFGGVMNLKDKIQVPNEHQIVMMDNTTREDFHEN